MKPSRSRRLDGLVAMAAVLVFATLVLSGRSDGLVGLREESRLVCVGSVCASPLLDGRMDEAYAAALPVDGFSLPSELSLASDRTTLRLLHDKNCLYGYVKCRGRPAERATAGTRRDDTNVWKGDSIELLFLCEDGLKHLMIGAQGCVYDAAATMDEGEFWKFDAGWDSGIRVAVAADEEAWSLEFALPLKSIPGKTLSFNAMRNFVNASKSCSWVPLEQSSWVPRQASERPYGVLRLIDRGIPGGFDFVEQPTSLVGRSNSCAIRLSGALDSASFALVAGGRKVRGTLKGDILSFDYILSDRSPDARRFVLELSDGTEPLYRYAHALPSPIVEVSPGHLRNGQMILDGNLGISARCYWKMHHNYSGADRMFGGRIAKAIVLTFEVPSGVIVVNGEKKGRIMRNGSALDVFEQKSKYAYDASDWIGTIFRTTLPPGTVGDIRYALDYPDGRQDFRTIPFRVINVPRAAKLREFAAGHLCHWVSSLEEAKELAMTGANTFNSRGYGEQAIALAHALAAEGFKVRRGEFFWPGKSKHGNYHWLEWSRDDEMARAKDIDGNYIRQGNGYMLSPAYRGHLLTEDVAREAEFCKAAGIDYFAYDMEDYAYPKGELGDYRDETIAAFSDRWRRVHPGTGVPDPRAFERVPGEHPEEHRLWVETKCALWGGMIAAIKSGLEKGIGRPVTFTEWSFNHFRDIEGRNHCMRDENFFRCFDFMEMDIYSSLDRFLRFHEDVRAAWKREFPKLPLKLILTPSTERLGEGDPSSYYWSSAPKVENEVVCAFKEAATLGAKGMLTYRSATVDTEYLRQFAEGVNLIAKAEDVVMYGVSQDLKTDIPSDLSVTDKFGGKSQTWHNQKRVFARSNTFGERTLVSVSSYRESMPLTVRVECPHAGEVTVRDLESGETVARLRSGETTLAVTLDESRRCRLFLMSAAEATCLQQDDMDIREVLLPRPQRVVRRAGHYTVRRQSDIRHVDDRTLSPESYRLDVSPGGVVISSADRAGRVFGLQTLRQLAGDRSLDALSLSCPVTVPCCHVEDAPVFRWRGYMLDVSRHFFDAETVRRTLDAMAYHKLNVFHWHLTDTGGWRLPVSAFPALTNACAVRTNGPRVRDGFRDAAEGVYGPFAYTKDEIRAVVAYAAKRGITVVPGIDIPGHQSINGVFRLSCDGKGGGREICPTNPEARRFYETVFDEVLELFPSPFVHIGGDEADGRAWLKCPRCQAFMREHELKTARELQNALMRHFALYLERCGRRAIGWDEVLEGGAMPRSTAMMHFHSWPESHRAAVTNGFDVVLAPTCFAYFDSDQGLEDDAFDVYQPLNTTLDWRKAYAFNPYAGIAERDRAHVLGVEGCSWTELVCDQADLDWSVHPRLAVLAEIAWANPADRLAERLLPRLSAHRERLVAMGIGAAPTGPLRSSVPKLDPPPVEYEGRGFVMVFKPALAESDVIWKTDESVPAGEYALEVRQGARYDAQGEVVVRCRDAAGRGKAWNALRQLQRPKRNGVIHLPKCKITSYKSSKNEKQ